MAKAVAHVEATAVRIAVPAAAAAVERAVAVTNLEIYKNDRIIRSFFI